MKKGMLVVLSGPSGSGKGTVLEQFLKDEDFLFQYQPLPEILDQEIKKVLHISLKLEMSLKK